MVNTTIDTPGAPLPGRSTLCQGHSTSRCIPISTSWEHREKRRHCNIYSKMQPALGSVAKGKWKARVSLHCPCLGGGACHTQRQPFTLKRAPPTTAVLNKLVVWPSADISQRHQTAVTACQHCQEGTAEPRAQSSSGTSPLSRKGQNMG